MNKPSLARVGIGRTGGSLTTAEHLKFQLAHARARDAVHAALDVEKFSQRLASATGKNVVAVESRVASKLGYLQDPQAGRSLSDASRVALEAHKSKCDIVLIVADGLSAFAVENHAAAVAQNLISQLASFSLAPLVVAKHARVALQDEIGQALGAKLAVILIGERPGLQTPDSLGAYLVLHPKQGNSDAVRNCISNIHANGLHHEQAANKIASLVARAFQLQKSGVELKEAEDLPLLR